jgi:hypothetical protein
VNGAVRVTGSARLDGVVGAPDGRRRAEVTTTLVPVASSGTQAYRVTVGSPSAALTSRVVAEAAAPPAPINEPAARAMALGALTAEANSSDKSLAANAALVKGLADVVLGSTDPNA